MAIARRNAAAPLEDAGIEPRPQLHVMFAGRSTDIDLADLDVGDGSSDEQVRAAVARYLDAPIAKINTFDVDRNADNLPTGLRPAAVFGTR